MIEYSYTDAILKLRPNACFTIFKNNYSTLQWFAEDQTAPTEEEILEKITEMQAEYAAKEYQRLRVQEYPSFADQFDLLYHGGYDAWKQVIQDVKDKYPKG